MQNQIQQMNTMFSFEFQNFLSMNASEMTVLMKK